MRAALLALSLALPGAALAHDPTTDVVFDPGYAWGHIDGRTTQAGGRIRLVTLPRHGRAAMTLNQFDAFQLAYRRHLTGLAMRLPIASAEAQARHAAWHEVVGDAWPATEGTVVLTPLIPGRLP